MIINNNKRVMPNHKSRRCHFCDFNLLRQKVCKHVTLYYVFKFGTVVLYTTNTGSVIETRAVVAKRVSFLYFILKIRSIIPKFILSLVV